MDRPTEARERTGGTCSAERLSSEEIAIRRKVTDGLARAAEQDSPTVQRQKSDQAATVPVGRAPATADELLRRCAQLRATHRCPGRCVFSGELRASGLDALGAGLDGSS